MGKYIVKRVLQFIPVFLGVTLILFALQNIVPGDPIKLIGGDKALSPEVELQLRVRYHLVQSDEDGNAILDENGDPVQTSLVDRYLYYMNGLLHGDLGRRVLMLQATAAAEAEVGTTGRDPLGRGGQDLHHPPLVEVALQAGVAEPHPLPGQGPIDEDRLALHPRQAPPLVGQGFDIRQNGFFRQGFAFRSRHVRPSSKWRCKRV